MQKPETVFDRGVVFVVPGPDYAHITESDVVGLDDVLELSRTVEPPRMVMDLTHTTYFHSPFLGFLIRLRNRLCVQRHGRFGVCHVSEDCEKILKVARLNELFDLFLTREEAIATYSQI